MPTPVKAQPVPFGIGRGVEYGGISRRRIGEAMLTSFISSILDNMIRDIPPEAREAGVRFMDYVKPGWMWGSPMQHAMADMVDWRRLMRDFDLIDRKQRYPRGVAEGSIHPLDKDQKMITEDAHKWLLYPGPKKHYSTMINQVEEHLVPVSKGERILEMLIDMVGHNDFSAAPPEVREIIQNLTDDAAMKKGLITVTRYAWLPNAYLPEQWEAREYHKECLRYQASVAGRKAKRLLLDNLNEQQTEDYFNKGYFFVVPPQDEPLDKRRIYVVERSYPNGNISRVRQKNSKGGRRYWYPVENFCYHTEEPHAVDDILLAQKLMMENDEDEFRKIANVSSPWYAGRAPLHIAKRSF